MAMISIAQPATWFSSYRIQVQGHPGAVLGVSVAALSVVLLFIVLAAWCASSPRRPARYRR
jgi:hypothetical protein